MRKFFIPVLDRTDTRFYKNGSLMIHKGDSYVKQYHSSTVMGVGGEVKCEVIDGKTEKPVPFLYGGKKVTETPWVHNLIRVGALNLWCNDIDKGLYTGGFYHEFLGRANVGTGTTENSVSSGSITASQTGNQITLSGAFAPMTANVTIKWDSGETAVINGGSGTEWTANKSQTVSSNTFTLYYTNFSTLDNQYKSTTDIYDTSSAVFSLDGTCVRSRTYTFSAETENVNYTELGFSTPNGIYFSRISLPSVITVLGPQENNPGQQLRVTYRTTTKVGPLTDTISNIVVGGWDTGEVIERCFRINRCIDADGHSGDLVPSSTTNLQLHNESSIPPLATTTGNINTIASGTASKDDYVENSFKRIKRTDYSVSQGNVSNIRGICGSSGGFACLFENAVNKLDTHILTVSAECSIEQELV